MGETFMHIFPADPRQPKTDWPTLRAQLLGRGFLAEPKGAGVPADTAQHVWRKIEAHLGAESAWPLNFPELIDLLYSRDLLKRRIDIPFETLTIRTVLDHLRASNAAFTDFVFDEPEGLGPGPLFFELSADPDRRLSAGERTCISFRDYGEEIGIHTGEGTEYPPGIPDTDRVVEDWLPFLERWVENPAEVWIDPETGRGYGLLELDWNNAMTASKCLVVIKAPDYLDGELAAALVSELTGEPHRYSHIHI